MGDPEKEKKVPIVRMPRGAPIEKDVYARGEPTAGVPAEEVPEEKPVEAPAEMPPEGKPPEKPKGRFIGRHKRSVIILAAIVIIVGLGLFACMMLDVVADLMAFEFEF